MIDNTILMRRALRWAVDRNDLTIPALKLIDGQRLSMLQDLAITVADDMRYNQLKYFRPFVYLFNIVWI